MVDNLIIQEGNIDIHCHGGGGFYFSDTNSLNIASAINFHKTHGTANLLTSLITDSIDELKLQIKRLLPFYNEGQIAGIHLEGPYLAHARCGAHSPEKLKSPTLEEVRELLEISEGSIKMITLAPELEGAINTIKYLSKNKVVAAIGHSDGSYDDALRAVDAGASLVTHFNNGMCKFSDGDKTFATALLYDSIIPLELILDGYHVNETDVSLILEVASDRIVFVTDAMAAAGQPDGKYMIGELKVEVSNGVARLKSNDALAGSTLTMEKIIQNARKLGISEVIIQNGTQKLPFEILKRETC